jgi:hypothetical protein
MSSFRFSWGARGSQIIPKSKFSLPIRLSEIQQTSESEKRAGEEVERRLGGGGRGWCSSRGAEIRSVEVGFRGEA